MNENFNYFNSIDLKFYKFITATINDSCLIFISNETKIIYIVDFLNEDKNFKNKFLQTWI